MLQCPMYRVAECVNRMDFEDVRYIIQTVLVFWAESVTPGTGRVYYNTTTYLCFKTRDAETEPFI